MIDAIYARDFAVFDAFHWKKPARINVIIGENDTGKTHLLKLLYGVTRSVQEFEQQRNRARETWKEVLARKLQESFQPPDLTLGKLVKKGTSKLEVDVRVSDESVSSMYRPATESHISPR